MGQDNRVVTVTINPAIDQTISIPNFTAGTVNRVQSSRMDAGGKGINVASFLADYGQPATVTGFLGADNDEIFRRLFERKGIEDRCVRIAGQTRIGVKISDEALNQTTDINFPGETPSAGDIARLFDILVDLAASHEWFVLSGSIPRGVSTGIYREMVQTLKGKKVVLDTSGAGFAQAVSAGPRLIKPNVDELREYTGQPLDSHAAILAAARELSARYGIASVIISMGKLGAIFVEGDAALWAVPPAVKVKRTVGAGDAMVAGTVAGKLRGLSLADCARLATAFSTTAISHVEHDLPSVAEVEATQQVIVIRELGQGKGQ
ncbi:MAG: 1-phosphofructokinase [Anaerolineae bacterium]